MKKAFWNSLLAASVLAGSLWAAPASADPVYVKVRPPAPIAEVKVTAPGSTHVWIPGFHRWEGSSYVWTPGRWELPPRPKAAWVNGHW
ncbi:MAG: hypothetical protein ABI968_14590, partial [Acidobacteriota bacterium]